MANLLERSFALGSKRCAMQKLTLKCLWTNVNKIVPPLVISLRVDRSYYLRLCFFFVWYIKISMFRITRLDLLVLS